MYHDIFQAHEPSFPDIRGMKGGKFYGLGSSPAAIRTWLENTQRLRRQEVLKGPKHWPGEEDL